MKLFSSTPLVGLMVIGLPLMVSIGCKKSDSAPPPTAPAVSTTALTNVTTSGATTGGTILTNGNATITQSGIVWSKTNAMPTLTDSVIASTATNGSFTTNLTGLDFNRTYYIRAFATNSLGTGYGAVVTLNTTNDTSKVRFTYNGKEVIYGIIISPVTGKKWLDRDLGASQVATAYNDYKAYGDFFQWGRPADGHQLMNWTSSTSGTAVNGTTTVLATVDTPGHSNLIIPPNAAPWALDWRSDNNSNRWVTKPQGPCPTGWHVPKLTEWKSEIPTTAGGTASSGGIANYNDAFSKLKLTTAALRISYEGGSYGSIGSYGAYWSSTDIYYSSYAISYAYYVVFSSGVVNLVNDGKSIAMPVRCMHD